MLTKNEQQNLEIALLLCLPDSFRETGLKKGRLKNLVDRLDESLKTVMLKIPPVSPSRVMYLSNIIINFANDLKWSKGGHSAHTYLAFSLEVMERSMFAYPKNIWDIMSELVCHVENKSKVYPACCVAGIKGADKWAERVQMS